MMLSCLGLRWMAASFQGGSSWWPESRGGAPPGEEGIALVDHSGSLGVAEKRHQVVQQIFMVARVSRRCSTRGGRDCACRPLRELSVAEASSSAVERSMEQSKAAAQDGDGAPEGGGNQWWLSWRRRSARRCVEQSTGESRAEVETRWGTKRKNASSL
jgi:hypothetical protein